MFSFANTPRPAPPSKSIATQPRDQRKYRRVETGLTGTIAFEGRTVKCSILEISANGARIWTEDPPPAGAIATVQIGCFGEFGCAIVWDRDSQTGIRFMDSPSHVAEIMDGVIPTDYLTPRIS